MKENKIIKEYFWRMTEGENAESFFRDVRVKKEAGFYPWCFDKKTNEKIDKILQRVLQDRHDNKKPPKSIILERKKKIEKKYEIDLNWCCDIKQTMIKKDNFPIMNYGEWRCWIIQAKSFANCSKCQKFILLMNEEYKEAWGEVERKYQSVKEEHIRQFKERNGSYE